MSHIYRYNRRVKGTTGLRANRLLFIALPLLISLLGGSLYSLKYAADIRKADAAFAHAQLSSGGNSIKSPQPLSGNSTDPISVLSPLPVTQPTLTVPVAPAQSSAPSHVESSSSNKGNNKQDDVCVPKTPSKYAPDTKKVTSKTPATKC